MSDNYTNFILTIGCTGVAIYCNDIGFKIFDSHARDLCGRNHPEGTSVLLEVSSVHSLIHYFQSTYGNGIFELKGVKIESVQNSMLFDDSISKVRNFNVSFIIAIYSLCYSVMKPCNYWNANTLHTVVDNGKKICDELHVENQHGVSSPYDLPKTMGVFGIEICINNEFEREGLLTDSPQSNSSIENDIIGN